MSPRLRLREIGIGIHFGKWNGQTVGRAKRAHMNMLENLVPFAALVLAAHGLGKLGALTMLGAQLFFWSRLAHAIVYIAGIAYVRTLAFFVGYIGMALIFISIIR